MQNNSLPNSHKIYLIFPNPNVTMKTMNNLKEKLKNLKIIFLDADGVLFDGQEIRSITDGKVTISKSRSYPDGQGLSFIRELGIKILFVSGEGEPLGSFVEKMNSLPSAKEGKWLPIEILTKKIAKGAKIEALKEWSTQNNFSFENSAYIGDDLNDRGPMQEIKKHGGIIVCPANALRTVTDLADITTKKSGGNGAIREFAEMILDAKGIDEKNLPPA